MEKAMLEKRRNMMHRAMLKYFCAGLHFEDPELKQRIIEFYRACPNSRKKAEYRLSNFIGIMKEIGNVVWDDKATFDEMISKKVQFENAKKFLLVLYEVPSLREAYIGLMTRLLGLLKKVDREAGLHEAVIDEVLKSGTWQKNIMKKLHQTLQMREAFHSVTRGKDINITLRQFQEYCKNMRQNQK